MDGKKARYCPGCKKPVRWEDNPFRPFCSKRCHILDLGNWASGNYRVPGEPVNQEDEDESKEGSDCDE